MTHNPSIRKAAILVSLLDSRSADALLEPMGEVLASQVRQAVMDSTRYPRKKRRKCWLNFLVRT